MLVVVEEQLVPDMMVVGQLTGDMIADEPLVLHMSVVVEEVNIIVDQLVKAVGDTEMDWYSMEESSGALGCIVPNVGNNVSEIITLPADAALSENDFNLAKNYTTYTSHDAKEFKPERWLKDGFFQNVSPFKFTAFQRVIDENDERVKGLKKDYGEDVHRALAIPVTSELWNFAEGRKATLQGVTYLLKLCNGSLFDDDGSGGRILVGVWLSLRLVTIFLGLISFKLTRVNCTLTFVRFLGVAASRERCLQPWWDGYPLLVLCTILNRWIGFMLSALWRDKFVELTLLMGVAAMASLSSLMCVVPAISLHFNLKTAHGFAVSVAVSIAMLISLSVHIDYKGS
uniref:Factor of DNA methylation 1-5/IDN2 domain-containing protein n=1 Tax=Tanacetum cinerariifolium TaxID=118510 RepID=A0A6L2LVJ5_TANCI|nr:uncharacterized protein [Tanacetum cinerariifolium]